MGHSLPNDSEEGTHSPDSALSNEGDNLGRTSDRETALKKDPWTTAEDAVLVDYVKKHGEGNWNAVQKHSGLSRCGKSCRLRWANHLRPNLKKGAFTSEEERVIVELHAKMGNKWARMAAHLPGRTDNEIKNYWNTRIKRRQRAGLPLYPTELRQQTVQDNHQNLNSSGTYGGDEGCFDAIHSNCYDSTDTIFDSIHMLTYKTDCPDISANGSFTSVNGSPQFYSMVPQKPVPQKHTQEQNEPMSENIGVSGHHAYPFAMAQTVNHESKLHQSNDLFLAYDLNQMRPLLPVDVNSDRHLMSNDIFSASKPFAGAEKFELPSLQYQETNLGVWDFLPPDASSESLDTFVQYPLSETYPAHCSSPQSSGLLEALLYESNSSCKFKNQPSDNVTFTISHGNMTCSSASKAHYTELKDYFDRTSLAYNSTGSSFRRCGPTNDPIGCPMGEKMAGKHLETLLDFIYYFTYDRSALCV